MRIFELFKKFTEENIEDQVDRATLARKIHEGFQSEIEFLNK